MVLKYKSHDMHAARYPLIMLKTSMVLLLWTTLLASTAEATEAEGCNLVVPNSMKVEGNAAGKPLLLATKLKIRHVRNVPDSGGSFGVDVM